MCRFSLSLLGAIVIFPSGAQSAELLARLSEASQRRDSSVNEVRSVRRYNLHNPRWEADGVAEVLFTVDSAGHKSYEIISLTVRGIQKEILKRILDGEVEASAKKENDFNSANYDVKPTGQKVIDGRECESVELFPKKKSKYLLEGWACIDTTDLAMVHVEGRTASSVSFWVGKPYIVQDFRKVGRYWYSSRSQSTADVKLLGKTELKIEYLDYSIAPKKGAALIACASPHCSTHLGDRPSVKPEVKP